MSVWSLFVFVFCINRMSTNINYSNRIAGMSRRYFPLALWWNDFSADTKTFSEKRREKSMFNEKEKILKSFSFEYSYTVRSRLRKRKKRLLGIIKIDYITSIILACARIRANPSMTWRTVSVYYLFFRSSNSASVLYDSYVRIRRLRRALVAHASSEYDTHT